MHINELRSVSLQTINHYIASFAIYIPLTGLTAVPRSYQYTQQLDRLASKTLYSGPPLPKHTMDIVSPVVISFWREHLMQHPDHRFAQLILERLQAGFPIGFDTMSSLRSAETNLISAKRLSRHTSWKRSHGVTWVT